MTKRIKDTIVASRIIEAVCDSAEIKPEEMLSYTDNGASRIRGLPL